MSEGHYNITEEWTLNKGFVFYSCLKAIRILQKNGHLMTDSTFFINYAQYGVFRDVRIAALECLVDVIKSKYMEG